MPRGQNPADMMPQAHARPTGGGGAATRIGKAWVILPPTRPETAVTPPNPVEAELSQLIVDVLNLKDQGVTAIEPETPLFGEGLGLDSIDALEIAVAVAKRYGVHLKAEDEATRRVFASVRSLALHIQANAPAATGG
jgi:acyl carrier protein